MPIPRPEPGESQEEFLGRCVPFVLDEGTAEDQDQAVAICMGIWEEEREMGEGGMRERRAFVARELRVEDLGGEKPRVIGYAALFEELSEDLGGFREKIRRGAFARSVARGDVRALWQHNAEYVLARTTNGTLKLREDEAGLWIEAAPPDTGWARDALVSIQRGDVDQMSFGFEVVTDEWAQGEGREVVRTLVDVNLFDVSPVTFAAYPQTTVSVRKHVADLRAREASDGEGAGEDASSRAREHLRLRVKVREVGK